MANKVSNLKLAIQSGTTTTLYASWSFSATTTTTANSSTIQKGSVVKIASGSKYYNGADIPNWVEAKNWIVLQVKGDRVVVDKAADGSNSICSAINAKYLTVVSGGGSSSSTTTTVSNLDHYKIVWKYQTGDGVWFEGSESTTTYTTATWNYPSNATVVKVTVTPVSKTDSNGKSYWTGTEVSTEFTASSGKPEQCSAPSVTIEKYKLTAMLENITDGKADKIEFYVVQGDEKYTSGISTVKTQRASFQCDIAAGYKYRVKCRAINSISSSQETYGEWSTYSSEVATIPASVTNLKISIESETSVKLSWTGCDNAKGYTVEYTTNKLYFDSSSEVSSLSVENTTAYVTGLASGDEWFFRVKATNNEGDSGWSNIVSAIIGTEPDAPTTWSSTTTSKVGDTVHLYWVHNTEDGSKQTGAEIELVANGTTKTITVTTTTEEDEEEKTYFYKLDTSTYSEGAEIKWRIRTKGITNEYSEWSIQRVITLYAPPTLVVTAAEEISILPYKVTLTAGPSTQTVLSYHIAITSVYDHESTDVMGNTVIVSAGEEIYSKLFTVSTNPLTVSISAGDIILQNNQLYKLTATVAMNSGLTTEESIIFDVSWSDDESYSPDAAIAIDKHSYCAYISPFCIDEANYITDDITLSVYRRETDGTLKEIATGLPNDGVITVTDPHPSLDYARYRIVAVVKNTGVVYFVDLPGEPIREPAIIIQWNEKWTQYNYEEGTEREIPPWTGSLVRLPYNINVSESRNKDISFVEYIGRRHPVSYYGTQQGETASWSTDIPKYDKETIYALRRLSAWDGDVYVREPSGTGYWASVNVSFSIDHMEVSIPVSLEITRVEGGI